MTTSDEMPAFCYDHYEHPLLWCDEKKRLMERRNAEESLRMWRRRKAEEIARKDKDKQEYYELFLKHCPWGRPGGGAPNVDVRRKDITAVGLHSTGSIGAAHRISSLQPCRYSDYFSQHKKCHDPVAVYKQQHHNHHHHHHHLMHPPRVTLHSHNVHHVSERKVPAGESTVTICERNMPVPLTELKNGERLQITLKDHPSMSFRNKGHVDIELRYKPTAPGKGKPMLEKITVTENEKCPTITATVVEPTLKCPQKKKHSSKMDKPSCKDPWGKAGPGGKPWRSPKAVGSTFMKSLGWTNKEMLKDLDQDNPATPAEKHTFRKPPRQIKKLERCCEMCTCKCPTMITSPLKPFPKKPLPACPSNNNNNNNAKSQNTKFENLNKQKTCPRFARHCGVENPPTTTDNSATMPCEVGVGVSGGGVELVPLLARRRANNRPISLSSTDVTKRTASNDRLPTAVDPRYLHDLNMQISQKRRSISITQQLEKDLCSKHFETFDTFWGRPGHGAPSEIKTKLKLDNLLYGVQSCSE